MTIPQENVELLFSDFIVELLLEEKNCFLFERQLSHMFNCIMRDCEESEKVKIVIKFRIYI